MMVNERNKELEFQILGVGAWGENFRNWHDLTSILLGQKIEVEPSKGPKPEIIPANERRRAPLSVRLAVETSWQACQDAQIDPENLASVFVSGLGDTQLTDYMCRVLASDNKALSPTKFHNSVHNAAAGYWTISTGCMQAANSVAGFECSVPLTIFDALIQSQAEQQPVLLSFYDAPCSDVLHKLMGNEHAFSASIIIAPVNQALSLPVYKASMLTQHSEWPKFTGNKLLETCYIKNPVARILPLLELLALQEEKEIMMPLSSASTLQIKYN